MHDILKNYWSKHLAGRIVWWPALVPCSQWPKAPPSRSVQALCTESSFLSQNLALQSIVKQTLFTALLYYIIQKGTSSPLAQSCIVHVSNIFASQPASSTSQAPLSFSRYPPPKHHRVTRPCPHNRSCSPHRVRTSPSSTTFSPHKGSHPQK